MKNSFFAEKRIICADITAGSAPAGAEMPSAPTTVLPPAPEQAADQPPVAGSQKPATAPEAAPPLPEGQKGPEAPPVVTAKQFAELTDAAKKAATDKFGSTYNKLNTLAAIKDEPYLIKEDSPASSPA